MNPIDPKSLIKIRVTRRADGTVSEVTLADLIKNIRVTEEQHVALIMGETVTFGDDPETEITAELVPS
jgi:hypothetical protein